GKMSLDVGDFDLRWLVEEVVSMLAVSGHKKGLEGACLLPARIPPRVSGDPARLRQVLVNLVGNAVKFTEKGEVVVRAEVVSETATATRIRLSVRDTGIGIPKDQLAAVFEAFTQVDGSSSRRYGGTGLGLTISRRIVELMGGTIGVESELRGGTTFTGELPFERRAGAEAGPESDRAAIAGARVLIIDDNATNRRVLREHLTDWGW